MDAEGDTPDRQRYYQGIQFYNPSITENTPEAVELRGVQNVVSAALQSLGQAQGLTLFDAAGQVGGLQRRLLKCWACLALLAGTLTLE